MIKIIQKGFHYSQDGPGNRLIYHLQGCNMHCPWCANPEGISIEGAQMYIKDAGSGRIKEKLSCISYSAEELVQEVLRSQAMFFEGGGVTFTGGEPTLQFQELKTLLGRLHQEGIHTAIENNGTSPRLLELLPDIDYLIMDFKHPIEEIHKKITGVSNRIVRENLEKIIESGRQIAVRIPLIHGFNDTEEALQGFLSFFTAHSSPNLTLEILPYHEYGKEKWEQCKMPYLVENGYVSDKQVIRFETAFRSIGIAVIHT